MALRLTQKGRDALYIALGLLGMAAFLAIATFLYLTLYSLS